VKKSLKANLQESVQHDPQYGSASGDLQNKEKKMSVPHCPPFDIVRFTGTGVRYFGATIDMPPMLLASGKYKPHTQVHIPLGCSRYGGPVMDLPGGLSPPDGLRFAAQIDLSHVAPLDRTGLLPRQGHLFFFANLEDEGQVIYSDGPTDQLVRQVHEHTDHFFSGMCIEKFEADTETIAERFTYMPNEDDADTHGMVWDYFAGSNKSKIFGIYTHCQLQQTEIEAITFSDQVLLLQVGENDFNDEGVFSVLIPRDDLLKRDFSRCKFAWGQS